MSKNLKMHKVWRLVSPQTKLLPGKEQRALGCKDQVKAGDRKALEALGKLQQINLMRNCMLK